MRKWPFLVAAAAVVVIGCGGGNSSPGSGSNGGGTGGTTRAAVTLPDRPALIQVSFLTGQGRAPGDPVAEIRRLYFEDVLPAPYDTDSSYRVETILSPARFLGLEQFTFQTINVNARVPAQLDSRLFETYTLEVNRLLLEDANGGTVEPGFQTPPVVVEEFPASIRAMQGRHTAVPIFLDSAILNWVDGVVFDRTLFEEANLATFDDANGNPQSAILGFLSDYVAFDISNIADQPTLVSNAPATVVYFSGDSIAIGTQAGSARPFEVLGPIAPIEGVWSPPTDLTPDFGTYSLMTLDPRDLTNTAKITSLMGIFRPYTSVLANLGTSEMITFPNSQESGDQDMVLILRNGAGQITDMYFGVVELETMTFSAFPIAQVDDGDASNEVSGTISSLVKVSNEEGREYSAVRGGSYTVTNGTLPSGFAATGNFVVFRR